MLIKSATKDVVEKETKRAVGGFLVLTVLHYEVMRACAAATDIGWSVVSVWHQPDLPYRLPHNCILLKWGGR